MNIERELLGRDIPRKPLEEPFLVYDPAGRLMKITGEYDLGGGRYFLAAEEAPVYGGGREADRD
jgi:hypothetical protein